ncbi:SDR family NAD(P)-dependent oxidoreductase [Burkholderia diffusa]|uniref:SDR family NAD(P)-dependent oxidoreductase n=1 Tax=Burkholderia diffusa TaxID=488732 RepID=UPI00157BA3B0|nr:SDR family NAD(P)-dependent oxidoreductase [Burkholderia diffusa]NTY41166.1 SDR family NAD(P)-dependent oxidoreductase [Burkholderia diffusa]
MPQSIIVTGGNTGLGFETAKAIASDPSKLVVVACRNADLGHPAVKQINAIGGKAAFLPLDLSDQASVRRFAGIFREAGLPPLYGIICNAGMQNFGAPQKTVEGYETTFAVNHLGHFLLVRLLLEDLSQDGRITIVSSGTHDPRERTGMPPPVYKDADTVARDFEANFGAGMRRYTTSKLCNIFFTYELARRLVASSDARLSSVKVNAIDPGLMPATGLTRSAPKALQVVAQNLLPLVGLFRANVHKPATSGARVAALTIGLEATPGGRYFSDGKVVRSSDLSYDQAKQRELWVSSSRMTGLPVEPTGPQFVAS